MRGISKIREVVIGWVAFCKECHKAARETIHAWVVLCKNHHKLIHRAEQIGNLFVLSSVSVGIHELEAAASGCVALIIMVILVIGDDAA